MKKFVLMCSSITVMNLLKERVFILCSSLISRGNLVGLFLACVFVIKALPVYGMELHLPKSNYDGVTIPTDLVGKHQDSLMSLLQRELKKNFIRFADSAQVPYYMSFRVNDVAYVEFSANFGALSGVSRNRNIYFVPQVRIGDETFDNFIDMQNGAPSNMQHPPKAVLLPLNYEKVPDVVSEIVSKELDSRYAFALKAFDAAKAEGRSRECITGQCRGLFCCSCSSVL